MRCIAGMRQVSPNRMRLIRLSGLAVCVLAVVITASDAKAIEARLIIE